ncbi:MAG TPA: PfkB family carbohydrate kinase [Dermatophilaceae bacterium]|nr:PfkB family carbohydrate kinase [Dermatophilaceae bacterium]
MFDPLAAIRASDEPDFDVFICGSVFLDIIFTGLPAMPTAGAEVWAEGMGSCPGGIANLAVAARRMGLRTSMAAAFGDDEYGEFCWRTLEEQEHVDLARSRRFGEWHTPVTVSMAVDRDRAMLTHGHAPPMPMDRLVGTPQRSRAVMVELTAERQLGHEGSWLRRCKDQGALVFADVGWDPTQRWSRTVLDLLDLCHAFMPNAVEAMAYTRTTTPHEALYALADLVPLAIVTTAAEGAMAVDAGTGEEVLVPALRVPALDATGAGDVFAASIVLGTLAGWPLADRIAFANLSASLSVQQFGGSLAAPGWGDIADWWHQQQAAADGSSYHRSLLRRYAFLEHLIPTVPVGACRRATATIARRADVQGLAEPTPGPPPRHTEAVG